jgi:divalent metal cation (Fe/Co/Zn/Cd) transporter
MLSIQIHWFTSLGWYVGAGSSIFFALWRSDRVFGLVVAIGHIFDLLAEAVKFLVEVGRGDEGTVGSSELDEDVTDKLGGEVIKG